jgi:UDP-2,3-diacylglucosamine pyrophosphatase LpxH
MRIAAVSDFHIGASPRTDAFGHRPEDFLRFLDQLEAEHDRIVLLGDIVQTEFGVVPGRFGRLRELARVLDHSQWLWRRVTERGYHYVHGNHDEVSGEQLGALERFEIDEDGFKVLFIHGHQFDPLISNVQWLAQAGTWMTGRFRALGLGRLSERLEAIDVAVKHRRFCGPDGPYAQAAQRLIADGLDAVVMGHTHVRKRLQLAGGVLANTGTCSRGWKMWVSVDTERRTVELGSS